jgi:hypothetical protein
VKKEDINGHIDGNIVQIDAEVKQEKETKDKGGKVLRSERNQGSISRAFSLAQDVDDAKSKPEDGVLTLEFPKKAGKSSTRLAVQGNAGLSGGRASDHGPRTLRKGASDLNMEAGQTAKAPTASSDAAMPVTTVIPQQRESKSVEDNAGWAAAGAP